MEDEAPISFSGSIAILRPDPEKEDESHLLSEASQDAGYFCTIWDPADVTETMTTLNIFAPEQASTEQLQRIWMLVLSLTGEELVVTAELDPAHLPALFQIKAELGPDSAWIAISAEGNWLGCHSKRLCPLIYRYLKDELGLEGESMLEVGSVPTEASIQMVTM